MLSWRRTLLSLSVVALLAARLAYYSRALLVLGALVVIWGAVVSVGWLRMRALLLPPQAPAAWTMAVTGLCAFLLAVVGGLLVFTS